ncbi:MAG: CarD family transcriptional regulator, partial [Bacteroidota bacterium]
MSASHILKLYTQTPQVKQIKESLAGENSSRFHIKGLAGSAASVLGGVLFDSTPFSHIFILPDHSSAAYFFNDLQHFFNENELPSEHRNVFFFPHSYKQPYVFENSLNANVLMRSEVLNRMSSGKHHVALVTYPDALSEKVVNKKTLHNNLLRLAKGEKVSLDFIMDILIEFEFERTDFVYEPGQFSIRGGIIDIFSYSNELPYRIEFVGDAVASLRTFDPVTQLSKEIVERIEIFPDMQKIEVIEKRESLFAFMEGYSVVWAEDVLFVSEKLETAYRKAEEAYRQLTKVVRQIQPQDLYVSGNEFLKGIVSFPLIELGSKSYFKDAVKLSFNFTPQPVFNKNFELLFDELSKNSDLGFRNLILTDTAKQSERINSILEEAKVNRQTQEVLQWEVLALSLHEGFIDKENKIACYTDHQIFERYHRFTIRDNYHSKEALTLKEIYNLTPGDYVTHIDHGIGRYDGLETIDLNGKKQEALRIIYKESDLLYVSIHSLHRISKYIGKEGTAPTLNRLGTNAWNKLKEKTK